MKIPGVAISHQVITPRCRTVTRPDLHDDPALAAFEEAVVRLRAVYRDHVQHCDAELLRTQTIHVAMLTESDR